MFMPFDFIVANEKRPRNVPRRRCAAVRGWVGEYLLRGVAAPVSWVEKSQCATHVILCKFVCLPGAQRMLRIPTRTPRFIPSR